MTGSWFYETRRNILPRYAVVSRGTTGRKSEVNTGDAHGGIACLGTENLGRGLPVLSLRRQGPWAPRSPVSLNSVLCSLAPLWGGFCSHTGRLLGRYCVCGAGSWFSSSEQSSTSRAGRRDWGKRWVEEAPQGASGSRRAARRPCPSAPSAPRSHRADTLWVIRQCLRRAQVVLQNYYFQSWGTFAWPDSLKNKSPSVQVESSRGAPVGCRGLPESPKSTCFPRTGAQGAIKQIEIAVAFRLIGIWTSLKFRSSTGSCKMAKFTRASLVITI